MHVLHLKESFKESWNGRAEGFMLSLWSIRFFFFCPLCSDIFFYHHSFFFLVFFFSGKYSHTPTQIPCISAAYLHPLLLLWKRGALPLGYQCIDYQHSYWASLVSCLALICNFFFQECDFSRKIWMKYHDGPWRLLSLCRVLHCTANQTDQMCMNQRFTKPI